MLALCLMLLATYYAQNYASIISWSLDYIYSSHCGVYEVVSYSSSHCGVYEVVNYSSSHCGVYEVVNYSSSHCGVCEVVNYIVVIVVVNYSSIVIVESMRL